MSSQRQPTGEQRNRSKTRKSSPSSVPCTRIGNICVRHESSPLNHTVTTCVKAWHAVTIVNESCVFFSAQDQDRSETWGNILTRFGHFSNAAHFIFWVPMGGNPACAVLSRTAASVRISRDCMSLRRTLFGDETKFVLVWHAFLGACCTAL